MEKENANGKEKNLSIVVPLYNEEENVKPLYAALKPVLDGMGVDYEIVFVDDGSSDGTLHTLAGLSADPNVVVIEFRRNFGQTAAFAAGFDHARGEVIITMDGDLQNDPADIPKLYEMAKKYDLVSGWRKNRKDPFIKRKLPSMAANWLIGKVTGVRLHDYGCSLKAYRKDVVKNLRLYGEMHRFIPAVANWYGVSVAEVETTHHPRLRGKSKYGLSRTVKVFLDLITVKFLQSFSTKPIQFFGPVGLLSTAAGLLISLWLAAQKILMGKSIGGRPLLLLGVLLIIVGIQLIGMGLLGEMLARVYHESQKKPIYVLKKITSGGKNS
ncbi:MAG: glycosyltransferase family 2 protein [Nitrospiraceae bacterium]|nr:glycosyltransferase family 2 protein [Nitrospiraceae bacterium]